MSLKGVRSEQNAIAHFRCRVAKMRSRNSRIKSEAIQGVSGAELGIGLRSYLISPEGQDIDGKLFPAVFLSCGNCSTLHDLADTAKNSKPDLKLKAIRKDGPQL